ncbi:hypothetical protein AAG906_005319 [Vitis piasezkii]
MSNVPYSNVVENLMYATMFIRPNICYVVGMVSCYQENPRMMHWKTLWTIPFIIKAKNCIWWVIQMSIRQVV